MKILVTGGAGFIGSAVIRHILTCTVDEVVNLDCLTYAGNLESLNAVSASPRYAFEQVDICDAASVKRVFEQHQPDVVMHLAAESHVDRSIDAPATFVQTNIVGTFVLLEQSLAYWQSLPAARQQRFRFHQVSTEEVFGDLGSTASELLFTETNAYAPSSPYSATKAGADHLVRAWHRTYGLPVLVTTCSNNYGPFQFPEKLIPHMVISALSGLSLPVYGDGSQVRDWLYVEDHARALYRIITRGGVGETYNIGGHNQQTNLSVVRSVCSILDKHSPAKSGVSYREQIAFVEDRPGHDQRYAIDASKLSMELGWKPQESFETGLEKTVCWYLSNADWWQAVLSGGYALDRQGEAGS